jgi:HlyD family secretion protein
MPRWLKILLTAAVLLGAVAAGLAWYRLGRSDEPGAFRTAAVRRGDLLVAIGATGTLVPEEVIDVGAQVAGQIVAFGTDASGRPVDYGSAVDAGTVLAKIDDSLYAADAAQAEAQVQSGRAALKRAQADLVQLEARWRQAERDWQRAQKLGPSEALAEAAFDAYRSAYETAGANVAVGQAAIQQARAGLAQAEANLRRAQRNLGYCTIRSPVRGVIIDRRVNIGQTVVASLNAPSLFLIAKDLKRMQVWVAVNEADIGRIRPGLPVGFTVDAFPGEGFRGEVGKIRLNASMTQNVVTYTVEIVTDNASGRLLPYLTANVQFELERRSGVLLVPSAALRLRPGPELIAPEFREAAERRAAAASGPRPEPAGAAGGRPGGRDGEGERGRLWLAQGAKLRPLAVRVGATDGLATEVSGAGLAEGLEVVTAIEGDAGDARAEASSPFTPGFRPGGGSAGARRPR